MQTTIVMTEHEVASEIFEGPCPCGGSPHTQEQSLAMAKRLLAKVEVRRLTSGGQPKKLTNATNYCAAYGHHFVVNQCSYTKPNEPYHYSMTYCSQCGEQLEIIAFQCKSSHQPTEEKK